MTKESDILYKFVCKSCGEYFISKPIMHFTIIKSGWQSKKIKCHGTIESVKLIYEPKRI